MQKEDEIKTACRNRRPLPSLRADAKLVPLTSRAPRAPRFHDVDSEPVSSSLFPKPKSAVPQGILRKSGAQSKRQTGKTVTFGGVETREVSKWIGDLQVC